MTLTATETRTVTVLAPPFTSADTLTLTLDWVCPRCGAPRGEVVRRAWFPTAGPVEVDLWRNPCGHLDGLPSLIEEASQ